MGTNAMNSCHILCVAQLIIDKTRLRNQARVPLHDQWETGRRQEGTVGSKLMINDSQAAEQTGLVDRKTVDMICTPFFL